jgi:hypothetical protein
MRLDLGWSAFRHEPVEQVPRIRRFARGFACREYLAHDAAIDDDVRQKQRAGSQRTSRLSIGEIYDSSYGSLRIVRS